MLRVCVPLKQDLHNKKKWWKTVNILMKGNTREILPPLEKSDGTQVIEPKEKAELLNQQFIQQTIINDNNIPTPLLPCKNINKLDNIQIEITDIKSIMKSLDKINLKVLIIFTPFY